ncbi:hypothetical protein D3C85_917710 [compost metagenome]
MPIASRISEAPKVSTLLRNRNQVANEVSMRLLQNIECGASLRVWRTVLLFVMLKLLLDRLNVNRLSVLFRHTLFSPVARFGFAQSAQLLLRKTQNELNR